MKTIILDTNILIDHVHGKAKWLDDLLNDNRFILVISSIVVAEYCTAQELETKEGYEKSKRYLDSFKIQDLTFEIAEVLGKILRRKTYLPQASLADLIIASTSLYLDAELATRNKADFAKIPDLRFFDPKKLNQ